MSFISFPSFFLFLSRTSRLFTHCILARGALYQAYESARCVACQFLCESGGAYAEAPFKTPIFTV